MTPLKRRETTFRGSVSSSQKYVFSAIAITLSVAFHIVGLWILEEVLKQEQGSTTIAPGRRLMLEIGLLTQRESAGALVSEVQTASHVVINTNTKNLSSASIVFVQRPDANSQQLTGPTSAQTTPVHYFSLNELTQRPLLSTSIDIVELATGQFRAPGAAHLRILINEFGFVDDVLVEESTLTSELEQIAVNSFRQAVYQPGQREGNPVPTQILVEVSYDGGSSPTHL